MESDIDDSDTEGETYIVKNIDFYLLYEVPSYTASDTQTYGTDDRRYTRSIESESADQSYRTDHR